VIEVQTGLGKKRDPISKITRARRVGGIIQVVEYLPTKYTALSSNSSTAEKNGSVSGRVFPNKG
jgi:hypothetical protein